MNSLLLTDSTMPVSFCKAGIGCASAMAGYLGGRVHMVEDVHVELTRLAEGLPALAKLLGDWPANPVLELDVELKATVAQAIRARQVPGQHSQEDRGEIATVFYARKRREAGELFDVVTDDRFGKDLARDRGLRVVTTAELAVELVAERVMANKDGERVWRQCTSRPNWSRFPEALAQRASRTPRAPAEDRSR